MNQSALPDGPYTRVRARNYARTILGLDDTRIRVRAERVSDRTGRVSLTAITARQIHHGDMMVLSAGRSWAAAARNLERRVDAGELTALMRDFHPRPVGPKRTKKGTR